MGTSGSTFALWVHCETGAHPAFIPYTTTSLLRDRATMADPGGQASVVRGRLALLPPSLLVGWGIMWVSMVLPAPRPFSPLHSPPIRTMNSPSDISLSVVSTERPGER